jgi:hypothetical protein
MHFWCGVGPSPDRLATAMESLYQIPFARFERYAPYGTPEAIADYVGPYVDAGAKHVNLAPVAATPEAAIDTAAAVADLLHAR